MRTKAQNSLRKTLTKNRSRLGARTVFIGADHAGYALKEKLKRALISQGWLVIDKGAFALSPKDDYPDFAAAVAKASVAKKGFGLLVCGSGLGMCIAANKIKGVRAVAPSSVRAAELSRLDNDANIICLSGRDRSAHGNISLLLKLINTWLTTPFSNEERHKLRIAKITKLES